MRPLVEGRWGDESMAGQITGARVLLVEDDPAVRVAVSAALEVQGFVVDAFPDSEGVEELLRSSPPDLAVLDVRLPGRLDGFGLAERLRQGPDVPVVFLTAADALEDRLRGFDLGCDDYLVKPFSLLELVSRLRAVLRRTGAGARLMSVGDVCIDVSRRNATRAGAALGLTPTEFDLLLELARRPGIVRSKSDLLRIVWGFADNAPHLVEVHISALRKKLEAHGPRVVLTARGGYVLSEM
jgi:two-component system, OmpR family, response regulator